MKLFTKIKQTPHHNSDDGHYYISISDLMTSLLFIFILILGYVMLSFVQKQEVLNTKIVALEKNSHHRKELLTILQSELLRVGVDVQVDIENGNMRLTSDILFEQSSAQMSDIGKQKIDTIAKVLIDKMKEPKYLNSIDTIFIEGHTDNTPFRSQVNTCKETWTNKELSAQRAINTYLEMDKVTSGEISKLKNIQKKALFSYSGYADTRPIQECTNLDTPLCRDKNRRIEFYFTINTF